MCCPGSLPGAKPDRGKLFVFIGVNSGFKSSEISLICGFKKKLNKNLTKPLITHFFMV
jgi:hypothetical protein